MLKMKAFMGLNWWRTRKFWKCKVRKFKDRVIAKQHLTTKLEDLSNYEVSPFFSFSYG